tara:strand:+ start:100 stop:345 length:246 start_codon:yes stop_codon:yes gene_type:complete
MFRKKTFWVSNIPWGVMPGIWPLENDVREFRSEWVLARSAKKAYKIAVCSGLFKQGEYVRVHRKECDQGIGAFVAEFNTPH